MVNYYNYFVKKKQKQNKQLMQLRQITTLKNIYEEELLINHKNHDGLSVLRLIDAGVADIQRAFFKYSITDNAREVLILGIATSFQSRGHISTVTESY